MDSSHFDKDIVNNVNASFLTFSNINEHQHQIIKNFKIYNFPVGQNNN